AEPCAAGTSPSSPLDSGAPWEADFPAEIFARSLIGAISETLVDLLDPDRARPNPAEVQWHIATIASYSRAALTALPRDNAPLTRVPAGS
ncbi:hypothetical protein DN545_38270, partial [Burkholderia multivorans]